MPINFIRNGCKGYLQDRRPNSEGDPYQIVSRILGHLQACLARSNLC
jgi:glutamine synthetase